MTYDDWKADSPDLYVRDTCPACGEQEGFTGDSCGCGWSADDDDGYDAYCDRKIDEARGK